jgi:BMFP domain-containing protein YqiC
MQTDNRLFDDLARVANGALHTMTSVRDEVENRVRERVERWLNDMDMVPREEFDAIKAVAQAARSEQEKLEARVDALEKRLLALETPAKPVRAAAKKASPASAAKGRKTPARKTSARRKADD